MRRKKKDAVNFVTTLPPNQIKTKLLRMDIMFLNLGICLIEAHKDNRELQMND